MYGIAEIFNNVEELKQQDLAEREKMKGYWDQKHEQMDGWIAQMKEHEQRDVECEFNKDVSAGCEKLAGWLTQKTGEQGNR